MARGPFSRTILVAMIGPCGRCVREWRVGFRGLNLWLLAAGFRVKGSPKPVRCMTGTVRNRCVRDWRVWEMVCGCRSLAGVWSDLSGQVAETQGHDEAMTGGSAVPDYHMARQP
jgi:hypothetical protein